MPSEAKPVAWKRMGLIGAVLGVCVTLIAVVAFPAPARTAEDGVQEILRLYGEGDAPAALKEFESVAHDYPTYVRVYLAGGLLAESRNDIPTATTHYTRALALTTPDEPSRIEIQITLADLIRRSGDAHGALAALDACIKANPVGRIPGRWHHARALALIDLERFDEAFRSCRFLAEEEGGHGVARGLEAQIRRGLAAANAHSGREAPATATQPTSRPN